MFHGEIGISISVNVICTVAVSSLFYQLYSPFYSQSSSLNAQLPTPSVDDVTVDTSAQTPDITARFLQTIPIDTEAKRFFKSNVEVYAVTVARDGRKLIAEKSGLIQLYINVLYAVEGRETVRHCHL